MKNYYDDSLEQMDHGIVAGTASWKPNEAQQYWIQTYGTDEEYDAQQVGKTLVYMVGTGIVLLCNYVYATYYWWDEFEGSIGNATWTTIWQ